VVLVVLVAMILGGLLVWILRMLLLVEVEVEVVEIIVLVVLVVLSLHIMFVPEVLLTVVLVYLVHP
jgi:hypothetical protein